MQTITFLPGLKRQLIQSLTDQPEVIFDGDNWAGRVYRRTAKNDRQRERILTAVKQPTLTLSRADFSYLYATLAYHESRKYRVLGRGNYGYFEEYYTINQKSVFWRKVIRFFAQANLKTEPGYEHAWSGS